VRTASLKVDYLLTADGPCSLQLNTLVDRGSDVRPRLPSPRRTRAGLAGPLSRRRIPRSWFDSPFASSLVRRAVFLTSSSFTDLTGMSKIWSVASALARMLTLPEGQWAWDEALPRSFELTTARLERARDGLREAREKAGPAADRWVPNEGGPGFRASSMA